MLGPDSSYSCLLIHICWNVESEAKMDPPIQTEYFLSGGAIILTFIVGGHKEVISFCILSAIPADKQSFIFLKETNIYFNKIKIKKITK
jgi:hypothetical protein